jgi:serine/threonine protein kinase
MHSSGNEVSQGAVEMCSKLQAQLGDALRILEVLGVRGTEYLLRAHDLEREVDVLLRVLEVDPESASKALWDFERRAESASRLDHPNIVAAGPLQRREGVVYYVVAEVKESSVDSLLADAEPCSLERAFAILRDVASALDCAHGQGVVHGHLDPSSISLRGNDLAWVSDFGAGSGAPKLRLGRSPAYMAPEQWQQDAAIDGRTDIYALGVIAFELITGRRRSISQTAQGIVIVDPLPVTHNVSLRSGVGLHVNQTLLRAVSKRPLARFATAGEFVATLERQPQTVAQGLPTERPQLEVERNPHFVLVPFVLVAAVGITVGVIATPSARQALHRFGGFSSITNGIDLRIPELPAFSDAPLARQGRGEPSSTDASADGGSSSAESLFPGAATAAGPPGPGGRAATEEPPMSASAATSPSGPGSTDAGTAPSSADGAIAPTAPSELAFVRVEFDGPAAIVMVDELPRGRTPFIGPVEPGAHAVRLVGSKSPFPIQQIRVSAGDTARASFSEQPSP